MGWSALSPREAWACLSDDSPNKCGCGPCHGGEGEEPVPKPKPKPTGAPTAAPPPTSPPPTSPSPPGFPPPPPQGPPTSPGGGPTGWLPPVVEGSAGEGAGCVAGAADCKSCGAGTGGALTCGVPSPFANVQLQTVAAGEQMLDVATKNTEKAHDLLGDAPSVGKGSPQKPLVLNGGGSGNSGFGGLKTDPSSGTAGGGKTGTGAGGDGTGVNAVFKGGGSQGNGSEGGSGNGDGGGGDASGGTSVVEFDSQGATAQGDGQGGGKGDAAGANGAGDPDNSETWSEAERAARLKEALAMDPDRYFGMIGRKESIFERVHKRYRKIEKRMPAAAEKTGASPKAVGLPAPEDKPDLAPTSRP